MPAYTSRTESKQQLITVNLNGAVYFSLLKSV